MNLSLLLTRNQFVRKLCFVFLSGLVCSVALTLEKSQTSDFKIESGNFVTTAFCVVNDSREGLNSNYEINYGNIINSNSNLKRFLRNTANTINYSCINRNWESLVEDKKLTWLRDHMKTYPSHAGIIEFVFYLNENEPKDIEYLKNNANQLMDSFIATSAATIKSIRSESTIKVIDKTVVLPEYRILEKKQILIKYAIIGFVLGAILSMLVLLIAALGRKK